MASLDTLARFVGGQLEAQTDDDLVRGDIAGVDVSYGVLTVHFAWLARGEGFPPFPTGWTALAETTRSWNVADAEEAVVFPRKPAQLVLRLPGGAILVFFPPGGSRLDPARIGANS